MIRTQATITNTLPIGCNELNLNWRPEQPALNNGHKSNVSRQPSLPRADETIKTLYKYDVRVYIEHSPRINYL
jgi:hypothetical protein